MAILAYEGYTNGTRSKANKNLKFSIHREPMDQTRFAQPFTPRAQQRPLAPSPTRRPLPPAPIHAAVAAKPMQDIAPISRQPIYKQVQSNQSVAAPTQLKPQPVAPAPIHPKSMADTPVVSIKISVPDSQTLQNVLAWRPTAKQIIAAIAVLFVFTIGYQIGRSHGARQAPIVSSASVAQRTA